jgi:type IV pilus assembly protein PilW
MQSSTSNHYIQTTPAEFIIGKATSFISNRGTATAFSLQKHDISTADIRQFHTHIYYIRSYSQECDGIPTLMLKAPLDTVNDAQALIEGIENMQFQYGIDNIHADGSFDTYSTTYQFTGLRGRAILKLA